MLRPVIDRLAWEVGAEPFEPHVTLMGGISGSRAALDSIVGVASELRPFPLELAEAVDTAEFFRCIVLAGRPGGAIAGLHAASRAALGVGGSAFWPHLSLLYAHLDPQERCRRRERLDLPLPLIVEIDAVSLVDTGAADVRSWHTIAAWPLGGGWVSDPVPDPGSANPGPRRRDQRT
ncbi:MAG: hypothetical protein ACYDHU_01620 [Acidimicrobiales bacterium]